jgi:tripartite ATP-independent transporter DctM subunit
MDWASTLGLLVGLLLVFFALGLPVFASFLTICVGFVLIKYGANGFGMVTNSIVSSISTVSLTTVPLFILMGEIMFRSGSTDYLFDAVNRVLGRIHGRLFYLVIVLSTIFGALSGSIVAVTAMLGRSVFPTMKARGYDDTVSATTILAGASLAPIIPPSIAVIVLGSLVNVSIGGLLLAGLLPGLLIAVLSAIFVAIRLRINPGLAPVDDDVQAHKDSALLAVAKCAPFILVIFCVIGFILLGIATPSESAATGVVGAILTAAIYRRLSWQLLANAFRDAALLTAALLVILSTSILFSQILSITGASRGLVSFVTELGLTPLTSFIAMMAITLLACMFIDLFAFMLIAIPTFEPLVKAYGFDPIWFWALFLINITLGAVTPPFGYGLFALKASATGLSMTKAFKAAWSVVAIFLVALTILYLVPEIVTLIPNYIAAQK